MNQEIALQQDGIQFYKADGNLYKFSIYSNNTIFQRYRAKIQTNKYLVTE